MPKPWLPRCCIPLSGVILCTLELWLVGITMAGVPHCFSKAGVAEGELVTTPDLPPAPLPKLPASPCLSSASCTGAATTTLHTQFALLLRLQGYSSPWWIQASSSCTLSDQKPEE